MRRASAENAVTVEKENVEMVATAQDAQQEAQPQLTQEQQEWQTKLMPNVEESLNIFFFYCNSILC